MSDSGDITIVHAHMEGLQGFIEDIEEQLTDAITDLRDRVSAVEGGPAQATNSQLPWSAAASRQEVAELAAWVDWLNTAYELPHGTRIAACWPAHTGTAEQIAALWHAWLAARASQAADTTEAMISWHERWLWATLPRIAATTKDCEGPRGHELRRAGPDTNLAAGKPLPRPAFPQKPVA